MDRRRFIRRVFWGALLPLARPRGSAARSADAGSPDGLEYLRASEYRYINRISKEIIPSEPVLCGEVDVAANIDRFLCSTRAEDVADMLHYLRLIRLAEPLAPLIRPFMPGIDRDIMSLKKVVCFVGYYSDANGEAGLLDAERVIWPSIGYPGPKPEDWWPDEEEPRIDPDKLEDRIGRVL
jgi:hypothetical protein